MTPYPHWMLAATAAAMSCFAAQSGRAAEDAGVLPVEPGMEKAVNELPAPALGYASSRDIPALQTRNSDYMGGTAVAGRVAGIYIKLAQGVFISIDQAPHGLRHSAERWVDVQFPEALGNGLAEAPALLDPARSNVEVGDAVEIRFAHPSRTRVFPILEVTRVIAIVAKNHEPLARDLEKRILGRRDGPGASPVASLPSKAWPDTLSAWHLGAPAGRKTVNY